MPIIPLVSISSLQATLGSFHRQLRTTSLTPTPIPQPVETLLPYCTASAPMTDHTRNVLSDICHSIHELARTATMADGQEVIRSYLSEPDPSLAEDVIDFWTEEYIAKE